jgi:hypothetical protein
MVVPRAARNASDLVEGKSYGQWVIEWWRWCLGNGRDINELTDPTGIRAGQTQRFYNVFFMGGYTAEGGFSPPGGSGDPIRVVPQPLRRPIFILCCVLGAGVCKEENPNAVADFNDSTRKSRDVIDHTIADQTRLTIQGPGTDQTLSFSELDRIDVESIQTFDLPANNIMAAPLDYSQVHIAPAGLYAFFGPFPSGANWRIHFEGACPLFPSNQLFRSGVEYRINVM